MGVVLGCRHSQGVTVPRARWCAGYSTHSFYLLLVILSDSARPGDKHVIAMQHIYSRLIARLLESFCSAGPLAHASLGLTVQ